MSWDTQASVLLSGQCQGVAQGWTQPPALDVQVHPPGKRLCLGGGGVVAWSMQDHVEEGPGSVPLSSGRTLSGALYIFLI